MSMQQARRKTPRVIDVDRNGRPKGRVKRWLTKTFKIVVAAAGLVTFVRNFGWKVLAAIVALAGTAGVIALDI